MARTAYVTGSTGFLGVNIIHALVAEGWDVVALRRSTSDTRALDTTGVKQVEGDVLNLDSLRATLPEQVDAVFHVAADTSLWYRHNERQNRINIDGTRQVLQVALEKGARRFIHTSSIGAYGDVDGEIITETTPSRALGSGINYYASKYLAEQEVHKAIERGLDAVIMNPAQIVGPYDYNYTPQMFYHLRDGTMKGVPVGGSVLGHVRDYARAHVVAVDQGRTGENYLLGGVEASFKDIFTVIGGLLGKPTPTWRLPAPLLSGVAVVLNLVSHVTGKEPLLTPEKVALLNKQMRIDSSKAERELGFTTCSLDEMFSDCYRWMVANQMI